MLVAGVDIGSTTAKAVVLCDGKTVSSPILPTGKNPTLAGENALRNALEKADCNLKEVNWIVATGYGRVSAPFANETVTEITCHARGAYQMSPDIRTVIDIGGQDSKVISLGEGGRVIDFVINDKCAAGTGRFLEFTANYVFGVSIEELGALSLAATSPSKISSTCTVFAQAEIVSLLASGASQENITAGLHKSIAQRVGSMAKQIGVRPIVMMTGGVSKNIGVRKALKEELNTELIIPDTIDPQLIGALGATLIASKHAGEHAKKGTGGNR